MYRVGIDLGGTNIAVGVVADDYTIVGRGSVKTNLPRSAEEIAEDMAKTVLSVLEQANIGIDDIECVGIGSPGAINPKTKIIAYANNLRFHHVPLAQMLEDRLHKECYIENDANAAAYGEYIAGCGRGSKNFVAVTLGTGVGGGIIVDNKIYSGSNYAGGELGHTVINADGIPCSCGRIGCFEAYASASALIAQTKASMLINQDSKMWYLCDENIDNASGHTAFDAMRMGDGAAKDVVNKYLYYLSVGLSNIVNIFQPEIICLGGGIANEKDNIIKPLKRLLAYGNCAKEMMPVTDVKAATLGNDAGIIGAAFLKSQF